MTNLDFAATLSSLTDPTRVLAIETQSGRAELFATVDALAADLLTTALHGAPIATITRSDRGTSHPDRLTISLLAGVARHYVDDAFALTAQQARGAWFLPEQTSLKLGTLNLPAYLRHHPAHAFTLAADDTARVQVASSADVLLAWSLLIPLFDSLAAPLMLRAAGPTGTRDEQQAAWSAVDTTYRRLGIDIDTTVTRFRFGSGWSRLTRADHQEVRIALLDALARHDSTEIVRRFRAQRVQTLTAAFTKKGKGTTPLARRVLTKALQPVLAAYFGGSWLALLAYLDAPANPAEEILTALPEPKLIVGGTTRTATVAADHGLSVDEVHAMLAAYMGQTTPVSPVEQRVEVMRHWWAQFDAAHARQSPGMPPLWGLVDEGIHSPGDLDTPLPIERLYRVVLPPNLVADVDRLWDGLTLPRWPEHIVSEPHPHRLMAQAFGPAVTLWHGVALTAWYVCEGPYSRSTLGDLRHYHRREAAALADAGAPVDGALFDELDAAERRLPPPRSTDAQVYKLPLAAGGSSITISRVNGQGRRGFELVRDIITKHRRAWAAQHLDSYLHSRWHSELTTAAHEFHRYIAAKGKPPTLKQFAKFVAPAANHWFGGDLAGLYAALGEKPPAVPPRVDLLPVDAYEFTAAVYNELGGRPYDYDLAVTDSKAYGRLCALSKLAAASVYYIQITEALGRPPEPNEFEVKRYDWPWPGGFEEGWPIYQHIIARLQNTPADRLPHTARTPATRSTPDA